MHELYIALTFFLAIPAQLSISALLGTFIHGIDLFLVENGKVEQKNSAMHELNTG